MPSLLGKQERAVTRMLCERMDGGVIGKRKRRWGKSRIKIREGINWKQRPKIQIHSIPPHLDSSLKQSN